MKIYYQKMLKELNEINDKKSILLHSCCAPCSSYVISFLLNYNVDLTIFYYNPNIVPEKEYLKRKEEQIRFIKKINKNIQIIDCDYNNNLLLKYLNPYPRKKEGDNRCYHCYYYRLEETALKAKELKFDYFTTTLSVSPYKSTKYINEIGECLEKKYNVKFLNSDFKKNDGYKKSIMLSIKYNLYRQKYCGCAYSLNDFIEKEGIKND